MVWACTGEYGTANIKLILKRVNILDFQNKTHAFLTCMISYTQRSKKVGVSLLIL